MPIIFAHLGGEHWVTYALYLVPVSIVLVSVAVNFVRDRRETDDAPAEASTRYWD